MHSTFFFSQYSPPAPHHEAQWLLTILHDLHTNDFDVLPQLVIPDKWQTELRTHGADNVPALEYVRNRAASTTAVKAEPHVFEFTTPAAARTAPVVELDPTAVRIVALVNSIAARPQYKNTEPFEVAPDIARTFKEEWVPAATDYSSYHQCGYFIPDVVKAQPNLPQIVRCALYALLPMASREISDVYIEHGNRPETDGKRDVRFFATQDPKLRERVGAEYQERLQKNLRAAATIVSEVSSLPLEVATIIAGYTQVPTAWGISLQQAYEYRDPRTNNFFVPDVSNEFAVPAVSYDLSDRVIDDPTGLAGHTMGRLILTLNFIILQPQAFQCHPVALDLRGNSITDIPDLTFSNQPQLRELDLSDNNITTIPARAFAGLRYLSYLNLRRNKLTSFPLEALKEIPALEQIDLDHNQISEVPVEEMLAHFPCLRYVTVRCNPLGGHRQGTLRAAQLGGAIDERFANRNLPPRAQWIEADKKRQAALAATSAAATTAASTAATTPVVKPTDS